jgi:hypothetical protein
MQKSILLQNWAVVYPPNITPYTPPELITQHLCGLAMNHPRFPEGYDITTSAIMGKRQGSVVTKSGSVYLLGIPAKDYEAQFPNAEKRLFDTLPEV